MKTSLMIPSAARAQTACHWRTTASPRASSLSSSLCHWCFFSTTGSRGSSSIEGRRRRRDFNSRGSRVNLPRRNSKIRAFSLHLATQNGTTGSLAALDIEAFV